MQWFLVPAMTSGARNLVTLLQRTAMLQRLTCGRAILNKKLGAPLDPMAIVPRLHQRDMLLLLCPAAH